METVIITRSVKQVQSKYLMPEDANHFLSFVVSDSILHGKSCLQLLDFFIL